MNNEEAIKVVIGKDSLNSWWLEKRIIIEEKGYWKVYDKSFQININEGSFDNWEKRFGICRIDGVWKA